MRLVSLAALSLLIFVAGTVEKIGKKSPVAKGKTIAGGLLGLDTAFADVPNDPGQSDSSPNTSSDSDCDDDDDDDC